MIVDMGYSNNNFELISVIRSYAEQRGIGYLSVIGAVEESIRVFEASKYKYNKIVVKLDPNSGKIETFKELLVIEDGSNGKQSGIFIDGYECIGLSDACKIYGNVSKGDIVIEQLPPISLRDSARDAFFSKKALNNKLSDIIKAKYFDVFKDLIGENVTGIVKRIDSKTLTLDVQNMETVIPVSNLIKGELFRKGDRIKAYLSSVVKESDAVHLNLSRTHPQFVVQLFKQEVPEVYDGIIQIRSVARIAGIKTKISVSSSDLNIDPVGSCVGMRGSRVKAIIDELRGEKIDIIEYSQDPAKFVINALPTVDVVKVILDEEEKRMEVVVSDSQLSIAIGKKGQNIGLISVLIGWKIDVLSEKDESSRRNADMHAGTELFVKCLDVEKMMAQILVMEGYVSISSVANAGINEIASIDGFDTDIANELIRRAKKYLLENEEKDLKDSAINKDSNLTHISSMLPLVLLQLNENGINTIGELADLSRDELKDVVFKNNVGGCEISEINDNYLDGLIMFAREKSGWFK